MKRNILNSPRILEIKRKRRKVVFKKFLFLSIVTLIFLGTLAYISNLKSLNITEIEIACNKVIDTEILKTAIEQQISGKYFWVFPKTNVLYYFKNSIKNELRDKFKRIKDIDLAIKDNKVLFVSLTERAPEYTWCGIERSKESNPTTGDQKCYFLDEGGYIFDEAPYFSGEVYFEFYGTPEGIDLVEAKPLGLYFAKNNFKQLVSLKNTLIGLDFKPTALFVKEKEGEFLLSSSATPNVNPKIFFNLSADYQKTEENLDAAVSTEPLKSALKEKYSSLQYIDLRFDNRVYYKFDE
jgi:hypothetical protein